MTDNDKTGLVVEATFGQVLHLLREAAGLSQRDLAAHVPCHQTALHHVEQGKRRPSAQFAIACDRALNTAPLLAQLVSLDEGQEHDMRRRALLATAVAAVGATGLSGGGALADVVRQGLLDAAGDVEDWDAVVADFGGRLVTNPSPDYGSALLAHLMIARQHLVDRGATAERLRAVARLGQLYGLYLGNLGDVASAAGWYRTAGVLADRSGDTSVKAYVRGRTASRGVYEGYSARQVVSAADGALSLTQAPTMGALEAHSAKVALHALTGDLAAGRRELAKMERVADRLPDSDSPDNGAARTLSYRNYLEGRIGSRADADRAWAEALPVLGEIPVWHADASMYYAIALVRSGDVADGVALALDAARSMGREVRVLAVGIRDVLDVVPAGYRSADLDELATYAARGPVPWETLMTA